MMSPSGLTRVVDRLEADGLVRRERFEGDARVMLAQLTDQGRLVLRRAAKTHLRGIREHFTGQMTLAQLREVASALETVTGPHHPH
jgi:DNA-binding MarR family transcriptional regulator